MLALEAFVLKLVAINAKTARSVTLHKSRGRDANSKQQVTHRQQEGRMKNEGGGREKDQSKEATR